VGRTGGGANRQPHATRATPLSTRPPGRPRGTGTRVHTRLCTWVVCITNYEYLRYRNTNKRRTQNKTHTCTTARTCVRTYASSLLHEWTCSSLSCMSSTRAPRSRGGEDVSGYRWVEDCIRQCKLMQSVACRQGLQTCSYVDCQHRPHAVASAKVGACVRAVLAATIVQWVRPQCRPPPAATVSARRLHHPGRNPHQSPGPVRPGTPAHP
jgi:hypothetical protein